MTVKVPYTIPKRMRVQGGAMASYRILIPLLCAAALTACERREQAVEALDRDLVGNVVDQADPALAASLRDQIVVDPAVVQRAGAGAPPTAASRAAVPAAAEAGPAQVVARLGDARSSACYAALAYGPDWAKRLPAGVPVYRDAAVDEAAGNDRPGCGTRVVSYASAAPAQALISFYLAQARRAGWSAGHIRRGGDEVVAGERGAAAFYVAITPGDAGSSVNIVANGG